MVLKVDFYAARGLGFDRLIIGAYGRDFTTAASIGPLPHVCSTSSRSRDPSFRFNSRSANSSSSGASKPVSLLPGDMKLLMDLQEFIFSAELPPHQVPSTRELARHGRQDLGMHYVREARSLCYSFFQTLISYPVAVQQNKSSQYKILLSFLGTTVAGNFTVPGGGCYGTRARALRLAL